MNRRTWIAGITATTLLAASLAACKQEQQGEETGQALPVMVVSSQPIELEETYSASIRGRQDVDIIPQVSGRIIRLCVKEGEQVATGQVLAVIDQTHRNRQCQRGTGKSGNSAYRVERQTVAVR